jgi:hypothetical protein
MRAFVEQALPGQTWPPVLRGEFFLDRNYQIFDHLGNGRCAVTTNESMAYVEPRGLPDPVSIQVLAAYFDLVLPTQDPISEDWPGKVVREATTSGERRIVDLTSWWPTDCRFDKPIFVELSQRAHVRNPTWLTPFEALRAVESSDEQLTAIWQAFVYFLEAIRDTPSRVVLFFED